MLHADTFPYKLYPTVFYPTVFARRRCPAAA